MLPLFPLTTVLFPGAPMPLHIFEPRYRQMLADCLEGDRRFGLVPGAAGGAGGESAASPTSGWPSHWPTAGPTSSWWERSDSGWSPSKPPSIRT